MKNCPFCKILVGIVMCLWALLTAATSQANSEVTRNNSTPATQRQIRQLLRQQNVNGLVIINRGRTAKPLFIRSEATGGRTMNNQQRHQVEVSPQRLFPIASMQKLLTGVLVQQLINQQQLTLRTTINRFYPTIAHNKQITIGQLLTHTSGIRDTAPKDSPFLLRREKDQLAFTKAHLKSKGNSNWQYANANFTLLAGIISQVTHRSYHHELHHRIINRLMVQRSMKFASHVANPHQVLALLPVEGWNFQALRAAWSGSLGADEMLVSPMAYWKFINVFIRNGFVPLHDFTRQRNLGPTNYYGGLYIRGNFLHSNGFTHLHNPAYPNGYACMVFVNYRTKQTIMFFANNLQYSQLKQVELALFQLYFKQSYPLSKLGTV